MEAALPHPDAGEGRGGVTQAGQESRPGQGERPGWQKARAAAQRQEGRCWTDRRLEQNVWRLSWLRRPGQISARILELIRGPGSH